MAEVKKKILIVEDDLALSDLLSDKLKSEYFDVTTASDGQQAVDTIIGKTFDLILLDLTMPWFDGFHVLEDMKAKQVKTPVVIMSNLASPDDINKAKALGAVDYFVKTSVTPEIVVKEIKKRLQ